MISGGHDLSFVLVEQAAGQHARASGDEQLYPSHWV